MLFLQHLKFNYNSIQSKFTFKLSKKNQIFNALNFNLN